MNRSLSRWVGTVPVAALLAAGSAHAQAAQAATQTLDTGDTAWMLMASALVLLMTPGLALFYGGMVRSKNVLATFMYAFIALAVVTVQWVVCGYSLAFGHSHHGLIGGGEYFFLKGVVPGVKGTIPHLAYMAFQLKFAIITPALVAGAFVERVRFGAFVLFTVLWTTFVYDPVAHWVWASGGWIANLGVLDFAGGTVVHWTAGLSALVCALFIDKRVGYGHEKFTPHNLPMTITGAGLLWFGWFGFNAGSALAAGQSAALALVTTHIAAAAASLSWAGAEYLLRGKSTLLGVVSGLVAGLVAITPAAGFVTPAAALVIGLFAGVVCFGAVWLKERKFHYDDALDAWGVHGVGGALGALLVGVFARKVLNPGGADGWLASGNLWLLGRQALGLAVVGVFTVAVTWLILVVIQNTVGIRVSEEEEREGLDATQHGEAAYGT